VPVARRRADHPCPLSPGGVVPLPGVVVRDRVVRPPVQDDLAPSGTNLRPQ
jgi:hypothetical protein